MVVMIAGIHISQEIFSIDTLTALKPSLEHNRYPGSEVPERRLSEEGREKGGTSGRT